MFNIFKKKELPKLPEIEYMDNDTYKQVPIENRTHFLYDDQWYGRQYKKPPPNYYQYFSTEDPKFKNIFEYLHNHDISDKNNIYFNDKKKDKITEIPINDPNLYYLVPRQHESDGYSEYAGGRKHSRNSKKRNTKRRNSKKRRSHKRR
jgi:hypothetical protein